MIVEVTGPLGSGKQSILQAGLDASGVTYRALQCDALEWEELARYLDGPEDLFILAGINRMLPPIGQILLDKIRRTSGKMFWIVKDGDPQV